MEFSFNCSGDISRMGLTQKSIQLFKKLLIHMNDLITYGEIKTHELYVENINWIETMNSHVAKVMFSWKFVIFVKVCESSGDFCK